MNHARLVLWSLMVCLSGYAAPVIQPLPAAPTASEQNAGVIHNRKVRNRRPYTWTLETPVNIPIARPFAEYETAGFLLFSDATTFDSDTVKDFLAAHLPADVKLVVFTNDTSEAAQLQAHYEALTGRDHFVPLTFGYNRSGRAVWARDNTPIPVWLSQATNNQKWALIDAPYFGGDDPDQGIANWLGVTLLAHSYQFEGGNFMVDAKGNCVIIDNPLAVEIPTSIFQSMYGCKNTLRLPHLSGIGHADERVKFLSDKVAVTDTPEYISQLQALGYEVYQLPKAPNGIYRTYANALQLNGKIFVPIYGEDTDEEALSVYRTQGLEVYGLRTNSLSDDGAGSIHCITMTYPPVSPLTVH